MNVNELERKIFNLESELERLKALGVFRLVPQREERSDRKGEWLAFKRRDAIIVDEKIPYIRRLSLPFERNESKAQKLLRKMERTKKAEELVLQIKALKTRLEEEQRQAAKIAELSAKVSEYQNKAVEFTTKSAEYAIKAKLFHQRAASCNQKLAALQRA